VGDVRMRGAFEMEPWGETAESRKHNQIRRPLRRV
jgi:hypothetical protein